MSAGSWRESTLRVCSVFVPRPFSLLLKGSPEHPTVVPRQSCWSQGERAQPGVRSIDHVRPKVFSQGWGGQRMKSYSKSEIPNSGDPISSKDPASLLAS